MLYWEVTVKCQSHEHTLMGPVWLVAVCTCDSENKAVHHYHDTSQIAPAKLGSKIMCARFDTASLGT